MDLTAEHQMEPGENAHSGAQMPRRTALIERVRTQRLARWVEYRLTVIAAAAGYGKTTLAAQLTAAGGMATAWLRPTGKTADEVELLVLLARALAQLVEFDQELVISQARDVRDTAAAWSGLRRALQALQQPCCLVIDDCHELAEPLLQQLMSQLLQRSPTNLHWMLLTRRQLPIALSRMRLNNELLEISEHDLQLEAADVAQFLRLHFGIEPSAELITTLLAHCDGWIAGLKLTVLRLPADLAQRGWQSSVLGQQLHVAQTGVVDYLNEEIIELITPDLRDFLLQIAFLPRFNGELCQIVTGNPQSPLLVERLLADRLFIQRDPTRADWYRLHQLLREALNRRNAQLMSAGTRLAAARRAADALAADGQLFEAAQLLQDVGDTDGSADLIRQRARRLLIANQHYELQRLLSLLPPATVRDDVELLLFLGWQQFLNSNFALFHQTLPLLAARAQELDRNSRDEVTALELLGAFTGMQSDGLWQRADAELAGVDERSYLARGWINLTAAISYRAPVNRVGGSLRYFTAALDAYRRAGASIGESAVYGLQPVVLQQAAEFEACIAFCREALPRAERMSQRAVALDTQLQMLKPLTDVLYLRNETDAATAALEQWAALATQLQQPMMGLQVDVRRTLYGTAVLPRREQRQVVARVLEWLDQPSSRERPAVEQHQLIFDTMRLALRCDQQQQLPWLLAATRLSPAVLTAEAPALPWLMFAFARVLSRDESPDLPDLLASGIAHSERSGGVYLQMWLLALLALHHTHAGQLPQARTLLRRALPLIGRCGAVRIILDLPGLLPVLRSVDTRLARKLADQMRAEADGGPLFTTWEERIVVLLRDERRPAEIAEVIGVAVSTVRYHLTAIYRKLGVDNYHAAVEVLRERIVDD